MLSVSSAPVPAPVEARPRRLTALWSAHRGAFLVALLFVLLAVYYNVSLPLWESDNELGHYNYVRYLLLNRAVPGPGSEIFQPASLDQCKNVVERDPTLEEIPDTASHQLERQPPLYYTLGALLTFWIDDDGTAVSPNPYVFTEPWRNGFNFAVHSEAEAFPYRGTALAVHVLRLYSTLVGLAGLAGIYLTALLIFSDRRYLAQAAMAVSAFIPLYVFAASVVNNDIMSAALGFWCVYLCVYALVRRGGVLVLAAAAAMAVLAMLAKYSSLPLLGLVAAVAVVRLAQVRRADRRRFVTMLWQTALLFGLMAVPLLLWLGRSLQFFDKVVAFYSRVLGSLTGNPGVQVDSAAAVDASFNFVRAGQYAFISFWGLFGWDSIVLPPWVVTVLALVSLAAIAGVVRCLVDRQESRTVRWAVVGAVLFFLGAWAISTFRALGTSEPRGRYLLPAYSAVTFLLAIGFYKILPRRVRRGGLMALCGGFLILAAAVPAFLLRPLYAPPALAASADLLPGETPINATFGGFAELVGYEVEPQELRVWDTVKVTLVWRVLQEVANNYTVGVHLLNGAGESHGITAHFPGRGNFATSLWRPGDVFRDVYELQLQPSARRRLPSLGQVKVSMYCFPEEDYVMITDAEGASVGDALYIGRMKWLPGKNDSPASGGVALATLGSALALDSLEVVNPEPLPGEDLVLELTWRALEAPQRDYTVFAHLLDSQGVQVGGNDQPISDGFYPSGLWQAGDVVTHTQRLPMPAVPSGGDYTVMLGVYDPQTGERLPVRTADGVELPDGMLPAATLRLLRNRMYVPGVQVQQAVNP